jgi:inositol hexakisphosphate/diphosphoinositol-pentakisphosphate kinase
VLGGGRLTRRVHLVGVCAMAKKANCKPMEELLDRLRQYQEITVVVFSESDILNLPVEEWPLVDALICFFSTGFPLEKAEAYVELRHPFCVNDMFLQRRLLNRATVLSDLAAGGVPVPFHAVADRSQPDWNEERDLVEEMDFIVVKGVRFNKPFVEKPLDGEDHNVYIYYPVAQGGGSRRLFRKIGTQSSSLHPNDWQVRRSGSFLYEEFLLTEGLQDIKCYTVGPDYVHIEVRKAPHVDGIVDRNKHGKEVRHVIEDTEVEAIARRVVGIFRQNVCGFDVLKVRGGETYVCDTNGWSFVKGNSKYYDEAAYEIREMILRALEGERFNMSVYHLPIAAIKASTSSSASPSPGWPSAKDRDDSASPTPDGTSSVPVTSPLDGGGGGGTLTAVPPAVAALRTIRSSASAQRELMGLIAVFRHADRTPKQKVKMVCSFPELLKFFDGFPPRVAKEVKLKSDRDLEGLAAVRESLKVLVGATTPEALSLRSKLESALNVLSRGEHETFKVQMKPKTFDEATGRPSSLLFITKYGGAITHGGKHQSNELGQSFQALLPKGVQAADVALFCNSERRVRSTALHFGAGLLQMRKSTIIDAGLLVESEALLGNVDAAKDLQAAAKKGINELLSRNENIASKTTDIDIPLVSRRLAHIGNPFQQLQQVYGRVQRLCQFIRDRRAQGVPDDYSLCGKETVVMMQDRWDKLAEDLFNKETGVYDISKVPDCYDGIKYTIMHNADFFKGLDNITLPLYAKAQLMADCVVPQEYGLTPSEKLAIGRLIAGPLLDSIRAQLANLNGGARFYFTSESHILSLLNLLIFSNHSSPVDSDAIAKREAFPEMNYLSHIGFFLYRIRGGGEDGQDQFIVDIAASTGMTRDRKQLVGLDNSHSLPIEPAVELAVNVKLENL